MILLLCYCVIMLVLFVVSFIKRKWIVHNTKEEDYIVVLLGIIAWPFTLAIVFLFLFFSVVNILTKRILEW